MQLGETKMLWKVRDFADYPLGTVLDKFVQPPIIAATNRQYGGRFCASHKATPGFG
jgi:hypothetical protein